MASTSRSRTAVPATGSRANYTDVIVNRVLADANAQERAAKRRRVAYFASDRAPRCAIQDLPLEILLQILKWVRPGDMLALIRTTRGFKKMLLNRRFAASIWEFSLKHNVEAPNLPDRPPFVSEFKYAALAFGRHCFECGRDAPGAESVFWEFRARYCKICKFQQIIPNSRDKTPCEQRRFHSLMVVCPVVQGVARIRSTAPLTATATVHKADIERLDRKLRAATQVQRTRIMEETKKETEEIKEFAQRLRRWGHDWRDARWEESDDAKRFRLEEIVNRLIALGYGRDLLLLGPKQKKLSELKVVKKAGKMNDKSWEDIRPEVVTFMEKRRALRLDWALVKQMKARLAILERALTKALECASESDPIPHALDLVYYEKIRAVIEAPSDVDVQNTAFDKMLPVTIKLWRCEVGAKMAAQVLHGRRCSNVGNGEDNKANPLALAKTIFKCTCGAIRTWPGAASHSHEERGSVNDCIGPNRHSADFDGTLEHLPRSPFETAVRGRYWPRKAWNPRCFHTCDDSVINVFRACNMDPDTTTCVEMDRLDARLSCTLCSVSGKAKCLMSWRDALCHCLKGHPGSELKWNRASQPETVAAKQLDQSRAAETAEECEKLSSWYCRHCYQGRVGMRWTKRDAIKHVQNHHLLENAGNRDVAQDPDRLPFTDNSVVLISDRCRHDVNCTLQKMLDAKRARFFTFGRR